MRVTRFMLPARPVTCGEPNGPAFPDDEYWDGKGDKKRKNAPKSAPGPTKTPHTQSEVPTKPGFSKSKLFFLPEIKKTYLVSKYYESYMMFINRDYLDIKILLPDIIRIFIHSYHIINQNSFRVLYIGYQFCFSSFYFGVTVDYTHVYLYLCIEP